MESEATTVADCVVQAAWAAFDALPAKCRPLQIHGKTQWVPCSAVVAASHTDAEYECISLATGAKCLPATIVPIARGQVLHDSHAEILAIRAFNAVLLQECRKLVSIPAYESKWVQPRTSSAEQPFELKPHLKLYLYSSEAPCGDASMELVMAEQSDATPWEEPEETGLLNGRGYFSQLGVVRRKPARADSRPSLSKSCSDKLALRQCLSLLSSLTALLIHPEYAYLEALVLPESQIKSESVNRAFSADGRMKPVEGNTWRGGYAFHPFRVLSTTHEFAYSRRMVAGGISHISAIRGPVENECIIQGIIQGWKSTDPRKASTVCREQMWRMAKDVLEGLALPDLACLLDTHSYSAVKSAEMLALRRQVKAETIESALPGWIRNVTDDFPI